jgi:glycosyltransferase involved in cell wall biosynthesis
MIDRPAALNRMYSWLIAHGADLAICVSAATRDHLPIRGDNLRVIWNGIPPILSEPQFARRRATATIGVLGRFNRLKGQAEMVRAAAALRDEGADFRVLLVGGTYRGDDAVLRRVRELIAELDLADIVSVAGALTDVAEFYREVDLVVVPSILLDPFPTVALEAMSAGKPVVAYAGGGLPEMLDYDSESLAPRGDVEALARLIGRHLNDEEFRGAQARRQHARYLENFTLPHYQERIRAAVNEFGLGCHRDRSSPIGADL